MQLQPDGRSEETHFRGSEEAHFEVKSGKRFYQRRRHNLVTPELDSVITMFLGKSQSRAQGHSEPLVSGMVAK